MNIPISFPVSPDDFIAYQEKLRREPIPHQMREALNAWGPVLNASYQDGLENDLEALKQGVDRMNYIIERHSASPTLGKFYKTAKTWIIYSWCCGRAQHE